MVTRNRVQGETLQLLVIPESLGIASVFAVFKGPAGTGGGPVTTAGTLSTVIVGNPWFLGVNGWYSDFGPVPPSQCMWAISQDTSAFAVGQWGVEVWVVDQPGAKAVLTRASFQVLAGLGTGAPTGDVRSIAQQAVENIEAYLVNPTNLSAGANKINNRELTRYPLSELRGMLRYWKQRLKEENIRASGRHGQIGKRINVFF